MKPKKVIYSNNQEMDLTIVFIIFNSDFIIKIIKTLMNKFI